MTAGTITNRTTGETLTLTRFLPGGSGDFTWANIRVLGTTNVMWVRLNEWDHEPNGDDT